jgi:hypothetical protein
MFTAASRPDQAVLGQTSVRNISAMPEISKYESRLPLFPKLSEK